MELIFSGLKRGVLKFVGKQLKSTWAQILKRSVETRQRWHIPDLCGLRLSWTTDGLTFKLKCRALCFLPVPGIQHHVRDLEQSETNVTIGWWVFQYLENSISNCISICSRSTLVLSLRGIHWGLCCHRICFAYSSILAAVAFSYPFLPETWQGIIFPPGWQKVANLGVKSRFWGLGARRKAGHPLVCLDGPNKSIHRHGKKGGGGHQESAVKSTEEDMKLRHTPRNNMMLRRPRAVLSCSGQVSETGTPSLKWRRCCGEHWSCEHCHSRQQHTIVHKVHNRLLQEQRKPLCRWTHSCSPEPLNRTTHPRAFAQISSWNVYIHEYVLLLATERGIFSFFRCFMFPFQFGTEVHFKS